MDTSGVLPPDLNLPSGFPLDQNPVTNCRNALVNILERVGLDSGDKELIAEALSGSIDEALQNPNVPQETKQEIASSVDKFARDLQNLGGITNKSTLWNKLWAAIANFIDSLSRKSAHEDLADTAENITSQVAQSFSQAELSDRERHEIFASFKALFENRILNEELDPKVRMGILLMASSVSVEDTRKWLAEIPPNLKSKLLDGGVTDLLTIAFTCPQEVTDANLFNQISPTTLAYAYEALNYGGVKAVHGEREMIPIDQWNGFTPEYGGFIQEALRNYQPDAETECLRNEDNTYVGEIFQGRSLTLQNAAAFGVSLESLPSEDQQNPDLKIVPLFVFSYGVSSGSTVKQALASAKNICNGVPENLRQAEEIIKEEVEQVTSALRQCQENGSADKNLRYVPIMVGHSMGGMIAHAVAAKNNWTSICFNPLGHGNGVVDDFVGRENWERANDSTHARQHISLTTEGDWVSDKCIRKPTLGQSYKLSNLTPDIAGNTLDIHRFYPENFRKLCQQRFPATAVTAHS